MSEKIAAMIEEIKALSVLELSELVHALEDTFGVSAAAVAAGPAVAAAGPAVCAYLANFVGKTASFFIFFLFRRSCRYALGTAAQKKNFSGSFVPGL